MVRAAARELRRLSHEQPRSASDILAFRKSAIDRGSGLPSLADNTMQQFVRERGNAPERAFAFAERGFAHLELRAYQEAAACFDSAVASALVDRTERADERYALLAHECAFWLGVSCALIHDVDRSVRAFEQCIAINSGGNYASRALYSIGQLYEGEGDKHRALASFASIRRDYPNSAVVAAARIREAQIQLQLRKPELAIDALVGIDPIVVAAEKSDTSRFQRQLYMHEGRAQVQVLRVAAFVMRQQFATALDTATAFLASDSTSMYRALMFLQAGVAALHLDSGVRALNEIESALSLATDEGSDIRQQALLYRALALRSSGAHEQSHLAFVELSAKAGYPYQAQALVEVGQYAYQRNNFEVARKALERADRMSADPSTTIRARLLLGAIHIEQEQWGRAAEVYERAEQLVLATSAENVPLRNRYLAEARLKRGVCLAQDNQKETAIRVLTEYLGNHPTDQQRDEGTFWLAEMMYRADLLKNAKELYEEIVNRYTASRRREEAMYGLAWTYFRNREFDKSVKMFGQMLEAYPNSRYAVDALVRRGDGLYISRKYREAAAQYEQAAQRSPSSDEGLYAGYQAGQALYRAGELQEASARLRTFAATHQRSRLADDALYLAGWIAFQQRNDEAAILEFERLLANYPDGDQAVRALYTLADARFNLGDIEGCKMAFRELMSRFPMHPLAVEAGKSLQLVLMGEGRTDEAIAVADKMIASNPQSPVAREFAWEKANIFYTGRNYKSAAEELRTYLNTYPSSEKADQALYLLGKTYLTMEDVSQALLAFADLEKRHPNSDNIVLSKMDLADFHRDRARARQADSLYAIVMMQFPSDTTEASRAGFERATLARMMSDTMQSVSLYRTIADRYPGTEYGDQSRYQLALYYRFHRMPDSARAELAVLVRTSPSAQIRANALYDIGDLYARERNWEAAIEAYERVRTEYAGYEDWYTLSLIGLGTCYENVNNFQAARDVYGAVAQLRGDDDFGKTAAARLKRLEKK